MCDKEARAETSTTSSRHMVPTSCLTACKFREDYCLPELVLMLIFDNLSNDAESLYNCTKAFPLWDEILYRKKANIMFHMVLPLIAKLLPFKDLLRCRLVSSNWKSAVDGLNQRGPTWLPEWDSQFDRDVYANNIVRSLPFRGWCRFNHASYRDARMFLNSLPIHSTQPFPTRLVYFKSFMPTGINAEESCAIEPDEIVERHGRQYGVLANSLKLDRYFHEMLGVFGRHIWHLVIGIQLPSRLCYLPSVRNTLSPTYLVKMLNLVGNLRSFCVDYLFHDLKTKFWEGPVPPLPDLRTLSMRTPGTPHTVPQFLLTSYGSQLENLECCDSHLLFNLGIPIIFPKLKVLKMMNTGAKRTACWRFDSSSEYHLHQLKFCVVAPRLEKLMMTALYLGSLNKTLWNIIVGITTFSSSLVELYIWKVVQNRNDTFEILPSVSCVDNERKMSSPLPQFSQIKTLHIHSSFAKCSDLVWFLKKLPLLQDLGFIDENGTTENLTNSEVTQMFETVPTLERIFMGETLQWTRSSSFHKRNN